MGYDMNPGREPCGIRSEVSVDDVMMRAAVLEPRVEHEHLLPAR
jgi:hypothetical protein